MLDALLEEAQCACLLGRGNSGVAKQTRLLKQMNDLTTDPRVYRAVDREHHHSKNKPRF